MLNFVIFFLQVIEKILRALPGSLARSFHDNITVISLLKQHFPVIAPKVPVLPVKLPG